MNKKSFLIAFVIVVITFLVYVYMGGYRTIDFKLEVQDMTIYGQPYEGPIKNPRLEDLFNGAKELANKYQSQVAVVDYPIGKEDSIKQFIGVISADSISDKSIDFKEVTFIKAALTAHPMVIPLPEDVRKEAQDFATKNGRKLDVFSIEVYQNDGSITVYFPTKAF